MICNNCIYKIECEDYGVFVCPDYIDDYGDYIEGEVKSIREEVK